MEAFKFCMEIESNELNSTASDQFSDCFFKPNNNNNNWDNSDPFESALSSIVSSPATATNSGSGDGFMIRELIGRLGNIRSSGEISPPPQSYNNNNSTDNSCYGTPLNSPPKLNLSMAKLQLSGSYLPAMAAAVGPPPPPSLAPFSGDPGFAERAAKNSLFGSGQFGYKSVAGAADPGNVSRGMRAGVGNSGPEKRGTRVSTTVPPENGELGDSREGSSVSDQIPLGELGGRPENENDGNAKKRKSSQRGKPKELPSSPSVKDVVKVAAEKNDESNAKKIRKDGASASSTSSGGNDKAKAESGDGNQKQTKESSKPPEPPKDYIHVRARRGQATDSHSLAERVRREKISERMKFLQDLVPGCNKVTGKAVMLDEIINYVQSLQRQVEFLSMKLATVNPRMEFNVEALLSKDIFQSRGSVPHGLYPLDSSSLPSFPFGYQNQHHHHHHHHHQPQQLPQLHNTIANDQTQFPETPLNAQTVHRTSGIQLPTIDGFAESASQASTFFEDDLQSLVQMGFGQIQQHSFQGSMASTQMKVEL